MNDINSLIGVLGVESEKLPKLAEDLERFQRLRFTSQKDELTSRCLQIFVFVKLVLEKVPEKTEQSDLARLQERAIEILIPVKQALSTLNPALLDLLSNCQSH